MENSRAWSKPRISSLSFQSIIKCRKLCDEGEFLKMDFSEFSELDIFPTPFFCLNKNVCYVVFKLCDETSKFILLEYSL